MASLSMTNSLAHVKGGLMGFIVDLHVHTIASGHAYSTLMDYVKMAKEHAVTAFGLSDHGPAMPGGPHAYHIGNQVVIPRMIEGIYILKGVEANIVDYNGGIDLDDSILNRLDYAIASLHDIVLVPGTKVENTSAVVGAMKHKKVRILGHLGNPKFDLDYEAIIKESIIHNVAIEINNSTFRSVSRKGSEENCKHIAQLAYQLGAKLILGSDAHVHMDLANFNNCFSLLDQLHIPRDYPINYRRDSFFEWLGIELEKNE
jgi:putative hydrolase